MKPNYCSKAILDTISTSWWPNDGPVHLRERDKPFDEELVVKFTPKRPKEKSSKQRILDVLRLTGEAMTLGEIAQALDSRCDLVSPGLAHLHSEGRIKRVVVADRRRGMWALIDPGDDIADDVIDADLPAQGNSSSANIRRVA